MSSDGEEISGGTGNKPVMWGSTALVISDLSKEQFEAEV
jgi:hypothetical protein